WRRATRCGPRSTPPFTHCTRGAGCGSGATGSGPCSSGGLVGANRGDDARAATVCQEARTPAREYDQPVLDSDQVEEMDEEPGQPGDEAGELDPLQIGHSLRLTDRRQIPLVVVAERPAVAPLQSLPHDPRRI